jgi:hypothetical protein
MPRSLRGLVLAGALVLAGCGVGGEKARDVVEEPEVTKAQLAAMVLSQAELGEIAAGLKRDDDSGAVGNDEAADQTADAEDSGTTLRSDGRLGGHRLAFGGSNLAAQRTGRVVYAATVVELMEDPVYAAQWLHLQLGDAQRYAGQALGGAKLARVSTFEVADVGDTAEGLSATAVWGGRKLRATVVVFQRGRVLGAAALLRADKEDAESQARAVAIKLDKRIQDVLAGRIAVEEAPAAAPKTQKEQEISYAGKEKLPKLTMAPKDLGHGLVPVSEGVTDGEGYFGYQRSFGEAVVGGSRLVSVRAETRLYGTPAAAARVFRQITGTGREALGMAMVNAFADRSGLRAADIRVRALAKPRPGTGGIVATFDFSGVEFRIVSILMRSGRMMEGVTGVGRADAFDPNDLKPVAERARARLVA